MAAPAHALRPSGCLQMVAHCAEQATRQEADAQQLLAAAAGQLLNGCLPILACSAEQASSLEADALRLLEEAAQQLLGGCERQHACAALVPSLRHQ